MRYEIFKENISNLDTEHTSLSDSHKFGKVMASLSKNKDIEDLSKLASGKISETLMALHTKTVPKIIKLLDKKYLQTKSGNSEFCLKNSSLSNYPQKTLQKHPGTNFVP